MGHLALYHLPRQATLSAWYKEQVANRAADRHTDTPTKVLQLHGSLSQRDRALRVQLRSEKISIDHPLFDRLVPTVTDPFCSCEEGRQVVAHVLRCGKYKDLRNHIFVSLSTRHSLSTILSTPHLVIKANEYKDSLQILGQVRIRDTHTTPGAGERL